MQVKKRDGTLEDLNIDKLHKVVMFSCEGITGVSASEVEIHSQIQFFEKIKTEDIQETLIKSAAAMLPGIPKAIVGTRFAPTTALFAASVATIPLGSPVPKCSGFFDALLAAP